MSTRKQSKGICHYCEKQYAKGGMIRHLRACSKRGDAIEKAGLTGKEKLYHLRVQDSWSNDFWLDLEVRGSTTLRDLDHYLRAIWLECCGHMSQFSVGGWAGREIPKSRTIERVFAPDVELTHIYDFGTSSETLVKFVDVRLGNATTRHPIALMARNLAPEVTCIECDRPAAWLCMECLYEGDIAGTLCDEHAKSHPHDDYGDPMKLYNSPRVGMCGYSGPAEPPY
jgi:hypothetical protein